MYINLEQKSHLRVNTEVQVQRWRINKKRLQNKKKVFNKLLKNLK